MTRWIRNKVRGRIATTFGLLALCVLLASDAHGVGIAQVFKAKTLPEATINVIDPETGTSSGTTGSDVNVAVGDILLFRFAIAPVPDKANRSMQTYLTEYLPPNVEVVGARFVNSAGETIKPRWPGLAINGCGTGGTCNDFDGNAALPCTNGVNGCTGSEREVDKGTIASLHGDTGIFWAPRGCTTSNGSGGGSAISGCAVRNDLSRNPGDVFMTMDNGVQMDPFPNGIQPDLTSLLIVTAPYFAHNEWDHVQVLAYGISNSNGNAAGTGTSGNLPYGYGSPVAGPHTFFQFEATGTVAAGANNITFDNQVGPWRRMQYPGSKIGTGDSIETAGNGSLGTRQFADTSLGDDVTPNNAVSANALRFAMGEARTGDPFFAEVAVRVTGVPLDPAFSGIVGGANVNCAESFGSGLAATSNDNSAADGINHPWLTYIGSPSCVFLRTVLKVTADKDLALKGVTGFDPVKYTLRVKNLSVNDETGVSVSLVFDETRMAYNAGSAVPAPCRDVNPTDGVCDADSDTPRTCPPPDTDKNCLTWSLTTGEAGKGEIGTLSPSEEHFITAEFTPGGSGGISAPMKATYDSNELPLTFDSRDITVIRDIAQPQATLAVDYDPLTNFVDTTGGNTTVRLTGTLGVGGTNDMSFDSIDFILPTGWSAVPNSLVVNGSNRSCGGTCASETPSFAFTDAVSFGTTYNDFEVTLNVPSGFATGLHDIHVQLFGSQTGFGSSFETVFPSIATVNVGQPRTAPPVLTCPIGSTNLKISGTSESGADISLRFNLVERATTTAVGTAWEIDRSAWLATFGSIYGGLEIAATATATGKLESELSTRCDATPQRECSDGLDNDGDMLVDFPDDPGCESPSDSSENTDAGWQCSDGIDNDGTGDNTGVPRDYPDDPSCTSPQDPTEDGVPACSDNVDNDGDGLIDFDGDGTPADADPDCVDANDLTEATTVQCNDRINNDGAEDSNIDFGSDEGCHSAFDDDESNLSASFPDAPARLLIVFDTSGSMHWNVCNSDTFTGGDGSEGDGISTFFNDPGDDVDCSVCDVPGCEDGIANDSRMFKVKAGISDAVAAFGEIEWGLMRFKQRAEDFLPPTRNAGNRSGGWQGGGASCTDASSPFNAGELLVGFARDNPQAVLNWMDNKTNYLDSTGTLQVPPAGFDQELRASGTTPLFGSLESARTYLAQIMASDTQKLSCRPYRVILVTDGDETCGGVPADAAANLFNGIGLPSGKSVKVNVIGFASPTIKPQLDAIANAGGTGSAVIVNNEADLSKAMADIVDETILVEVCNDLDDDCDGQVDEDSDPGDFCYTFGAGNGCDVATGQCQGECALGTNQCVTGGVVACVGDVGPTTETCPNDGKDNDCNGVVDDVPGGCPICTPTQEICNGVDDDCDNAVDEHDPGSTDPNEQLPGVGDDCGLSVGECAPGELICDSGLGQLVCDYTNQGQGPETEVCDTLDNDCNGLTDEIVNECYTFPTGCTDTGAGYTCNGICRTGTEQCESDGMGGAQLSACTGQQGPGTETCNGIDDDCDGVVDNGFTGPAGEALGSACSKGTGQCASTGEWQCTSDGMGVECNAPDISPGIEVCNNLDDDCDGKVDETDDAPPGGLGPPIGEVCGGGGGCGTGTFECVNGVIECTGVTGGSAEVCNGLDDNCNDVVDEGTDPNTNCYTFATGCDVGAGTCQGECMFGLDKCVAGDIACVGDVGPAPETCDGKDNDCDGMVDNMAECPSPTDICVDAECVSPCGTGEFPCGFGFFCKDLGDAACGNPPCRFCLPDPCKDVTCNDGETCNQDTGACEDPCDNVTCESNQTCRFGGCFNCLQLPCDEGEICEVDTGCVPDPCKDVTCADNQTCNDGTCECLFCDPGCGVGERCDTNTCGCVPDACQGVECPGSQVCNPASGECEGNKCDGVQCPSGQACNPDDGMCISDPCANANCPTGQHCEVTFGGQPTCVFDVPPDKGDLVYASGGGGCACGGTISSSPSGDTLVWVLLVAGVLLRRRRRRDEA